MIQLLGFYSLHLILYPKLVSVSSSISSSAFLSHSYAVYQKLSSIPKYLYAFLGSSSLMSLSNVLPTCNLLWTLPLFKHILLLLLLRLLLLLLLLLSSLVTGLFFPVLLLNQRWSPPLTLQASHCTTFRIMCDVPSIVVFCSESIECFPGAASFIKLLVTIPVAPIITSIIVHFKFHIRCISVPTCKLVYFNFFTASFSTTFLSAGIATSISVQVFYYYYYY